MAQAQYERDLASNRVKWRRAWFVIVAVAVFNFIKRPLELPWLDSTIVAWLTTFIAVLTAGYLLVLRSQHRRLVRALNLHRQAEQYARGRAEQLARTRAPRNLVKPPDDGSGRSSGGSRVSMRVHSRSRRDRR